MTSYIDMKMIDDILNDYYLCCFTDEEEIVMV